MVFMSRQFPRHSITDIPLHSWNVLVLLEPWHGAISCIKIYPFCWNTAHSHTILISWIISLLYFVLSIIPFTFSLKRDASAANGYTDLHTYWRFYSSLNTLTIIFLILFAPKMTMASIVKTAKYRLMWMFCVPTEGVYLCMILRHSISLKELEHSLNVTKSTFWNSKGICQKLVP